MKGVRYHVFAAVTKQEHATVRRLAAQRCLSVSNLVRRAVNSMLLDEGDTAPLLEERHGHGGRPRRIDAADSLRL